MFLLTGITSFTSKMNTNVVRLEAIIELSDLTLVCGLSVAIAFFWDCLNNNDGLFWCKIKSAFNSVFSHNEGENSQVVSKTETAPKESPAVTSNKMQAQNKKYCKMQKLIKMLLTLTKLKLLVEREKLEMK